MKNLILITLLFASSSAFSAMPLTLSSPSPDTLSAHSRHWLGKFYVAGTVTSALPGVRVPGSFVEVQLLDAKGQRVAAARDRIGRPAGHPRLRRYHTARYVVSFPDTLARQAVSAWIKFHNHAPGSCPPRC